MYRNAEAGYGVVETESGFVYAMRPAPEPSAPTDDEALTRYANELTDGNAETLQEATENLIKIIKED
jgi:hypothetical protein